jgi:hypothetical protein
VTDRGPSWDVAARSAYQFESFRAPDAVRVVASDGDSFTFDRDVALVLPGGAAEGYHFDAIEEANEHRFAGITIAGQRLRFVLPYSGVIRAQRFSPGKTAVLCAGITLAAAAIAGGIFLSQLHTISFGGGNWGESNFYTRPRP